jgi:hypothetical protein
MAVSNRVRTSGHCKADIALRLGVPVLKEVQKILNRQAGVREDVAQGALGDIAPRVDRDSSAATVRMAHYIMTTRHARYLETGPL